MATAKKPGKEVVYLDIDDDITTIVDKVEAPKEKLVALVLPKRFTTLQSTVNMRLLKRAADSAGKNIVLITTDTALLPLAGVAGIHVAKNLQSAPEIPPSPVDLPSKPAVPEDPDAEIDAKDAKLDYHRSIGELAASGAVEEPETIPLEDADEEEKPAAAKKPPKDKKLKVPNFERFRLLLALGAVGLIALIVFAVMALVVWPKATITIKTEAEPISAVFELTTSSDTDSLDTEKGIIPGELKTADLKSEKEVPATGEENKGKKATGSVTMTAQDCVPLGDTPEDVPAGSGVSSGGLFYITQENAQFSFDGGSGSCINYKSDSVSIIAQAGGSNYNKSNASFSVTGRSDVEASGSASGGTDNIVKILTQADVNKAANEISDEDKTKFLDDFKKQLDEEGFFVIDDTVQVRNPSIKASPAVGEPASTANVTISIRHTALVVSKDLLKTAVAEELNKQLDKDRQEIGSDDVLSDTTVSVSSQKSSRVATLNVNASSTAVPIIDADSIKSQVGGKKESEIRALLSELPGVKEVEVSMSPFWVSKAPGKPGKITVKFEQLATPDDSGS